MSAGRTGPGTGAGPSGATLATGWGRCRDGGVGRAAAVWRLPAVPETCGAERRCGAAERAAARDTKSRAGSGWPGSCPFGGVVADDGAEDDAGTGAGGADGGADGGAADGGAAGGLSLAPDGGAWTVIGRGVRADDRGDGDCVWGGATAGGVDAGPVGPSSGVLTRRARSPPALAAPRARAAAALVVRAGVGCSVIGPHPPRPVAGAAIAGPARWCAAGSGPRRRLHAAMAGARWSMRRPTRRNHHRQPRPGSR